MVDSHKNIFIAAGSSNSEVGKLKAGNTRESVAVSKSWLVLPYRTPKLIVACMISTAVAKLLRRATISVHDNIRNKKSGSIVILPIQTFTSF